MLNTSKDSLLTGVSPLIHISGLVPVSFLGAKARSLPSLHHFAPDSCFSILDATYQDCQCHLLQPYLLQHTLCLITVIILAPVIVLSPHY